MNLDAYQSWTKAQDIDELYFNKYHVEANNPDDIFWMETEKGVSLALLDPMELHRENIYNKEMAWCQTIETELLDKYYTATKISKELQLHKKELQEILKNKENPISTNILNKEFIKSLKASFIDEQGNHRLPKDHKIKMVIAARNKLFKIDSQYGKKE